MGEPKHALHRNGVRLRSAHRQRERAGVMRSITGAAPLPSWRGATSCYVFLFPTISPTGRTAPVVSSCSRVERRDDPEEGRVSLRMSGAPTVPWFWTTS